MNQKIIDNNIENMIYEIRGRQVMLDSDIAKLYETETKRINEAVKNNPDKFPKRYSWKLSIEETKNISRSNCSTLKIQKGHNIKYGARVFTEEGVAMLATILHTKVATEVSISIMDVFVKMRHFIKDNANIFNSLNNINIKLIEHDSKINKLFDEFDKKDNHLFLENTTFDSYIDILNILKRTKNELIIIDNYADINTLNLIKKLDVKVTIISNNKRYLTKEDIDKYNSEYNNLNVIFNNSFHDRYIIIDNKDVFFLGSSINNVGSKISSIIKCNDNNIIVYLLNKIKEIKKED